MTAAWAAVVAGEDAAIFAIGVAGARLGTGERQRVRGQLAAHQDARDRAAAAVRAGGGTPPPPEAAYALPFPVRSPASARRLLALVENRLVPVYADAASEAVDADRRYAARTAARCATRAVEWGAPSQAFPTGD